MTDIETTKEMLSELRLSDAELEDVRVICDILADIVVDGWFERQKQDQHEIQDNS